MSYSIGMDHLQVLREKVESLRAEIAQIREANEQYRLQRGNETEAHMAHGQRQDRLQEIQQELSRLSQLGRKVLSAEERKAEHRSRLHLVKKAS